MITVLSNQSLLDISIQEDGSIFSALDWAQKNQISITDDLLPGQKLIKPETIYYNIEVVNYFKTRRQNIATLGKSDTKNTIEHNFPLEFPISL